MKNNNLEKIYSKLPKDKTLLKAELAKVELAIADDIKGLINQMKGKVQEMKNGEKEADDFKKRIDKIFAEADKAEKRLEKAEEYKQISASSLSTKIYAPKADKLFFINFFLTGFKFCLDKAITLGVFND